MLDIYSLYANQIRTLRHYFHNNQTTLCKAIAQADTEYTPLNLSNNEEELIHPQPQNIKIEQWAQKKLHGKHLHIVANNNISQQDTYKWLQKGHLYPETEGFLLAIQDQVIATRNYQKHIMKIEQVDDCCRRCHQQQENLEHIVGGCKILAGTAYTERHNTAANILHQAISLKLKLSTDDAPYYNYVPSSVLENMEYKLYYDRSIHTDKTIVCNRPDIVLQDKVRKTTYFIEVSIPTDTNVAKKYTEKIDKYIPLAIETERVWKQERVSIMPFIMSATGITHVKFKQHLEELKLDSETHHKIQRAVILKTCNIVRTFLKQ